MGKIFTQERFITMDPFLSLRLNALEKHHLIRSVSDGDPVGVAGELCGLHSTGATTPYLSLFARIYPFTIEHLDEELFKKRRLIKTRCFRNTVHVVPTDMLPVVYAATGRSVQYRTLKYLKNMGIDVDEFDGLSQRISSLLKGRGLTVREIKSELETDANLSAVVNMMCDLCILVRGPPTGGWRSNIHTYHLIDEWIPGIEIGGIGEEAAVMEIILRYIDAYGPVTVDDIAWWGGFTKGRVLDNLNELDRLVRETDCWDEKMYHMEKEDEAENDIKTGFVNLLPGSDPYLMGYKLRERYLDKAQTELVFDRSGNATSTILVDGGVIGIWDVDFDSRVVKVHFFSEQDEGVLKDVRKRAMQIGSFVVGSQVEFRECKDMVPLTKRTAGGFMSPLRDC